jgi:hypothetical protein
MATTTDDSDCPTYTVKCERRSPCTNGDEAHR